MKTPSLIFALAAGLQVSSAAAQTNSPAAAPIPLSPAVQRTLEGTTLGVLTEEQRLSLVKPAEAHQEKLRELQQQVRVARHEMFSTALKETFDEAAVRTKAQTVANIESEITVLRLKLLSQVQPPLTPQQVERLRSLGFSAPGLRPIESRPGRQRILHNTPRDANGLPPKL